MALMKCPRCELNYIKDTEKLCSVCLREIKGFHNEDETELCSICKSAPALPGKDVCANCLHEMNDNLTDDDTTADVGVSDNDVLDIDAVDPINESLLPDEIKDEDMEKLDRELSLEKAIEDEEEEENEDDEYDRYDKCDHTHHE